MFAYLKMVHSSNAKGTVRLPVLDDAHHGSSHTHVDGLSHLRQEVLLDLKAPLPDAPAPIHEEDQVHLTICKNRTRHSRFNNVFGVADVKGNPWSF